MRHAMVLDGRTETAREGEGSARSRKGAMDLMPWASKVVRVTGGWMGWESVADYETWSRQAGDATSPTPMSLRGLTAFDRASLARIAEAEDRSVGYVIRRAIRREIERSEKQEGGR